MTLRKVGFIARGTFFSPILDFKFKNVNKVSSMCGILFAGVLVQHFSEIRTRKDQRDSVFLLD